MPRRTINHIRKDLMDGFNKYLTVDSSGNFITPDEAYEILKETGKPVYNSIVAHFGDVFTESQNMRHMFDIFRGRRKKDMIYIGPIYGRGYKSANLAHLFEFGTAPRMRRSINEEGKVKMVSTGQIKATPFMRPAWLETKDRFVIDTEKAIKALIEYKLKRQGWV